jgi:hypothetical protein
VNRREALKSIAAALAGIAVAPSLTTAAPLVTKLETNKWLDINIVFDLKRRCIKTFTVNSEDASHDLIHLPNYVRLYDTGLELGPRGSGMRMVVPHLLKGNFLHVGFSLNIKLQSTLYDDLYLLNPG